MTLRFSPFCRRAPCLGTLADINEQTSGSGDGVSLSIGTLLGNIEGALLPGTLKER